MAVFVDTFLLVALALFIREMSAAIPCIIGQEPDPATGNSYRWVIPVKDPCQCTQVRVGGRTSTQALCRPFPVTYYDSFFESDDPAEIRRLLNCSGMSPCRSEDVQPIGMEDGSIPDGSISASSVYYTSDSPESYYTPHMARLHNTDGAQAWCAAGDDQDLWIQVDFMRKVYVTGVITQGRGGSERWVTEYRVLYGDDGEHWDHAMCSPQNTQLFHGNTDSDTPVRRDFMSYVPARYLRIEPVAFYPYCCLRFELLGCKNIVETNE